MDFSPDKQAMVDALYLMLHSKGYVSTEVIIEALAVIASPAVLDVLNIIESQDIRRETERQAKLDAMNANEVARPA